MTTNDEKERMRVDDRTQEVIESSCRAGIVGPARRTARGSTCRCARAGLNRVQPSAFLRLNGEGNFHPDWATVSIDQRAARVSTGLNARDHRRPEGHRPRRDEAVYADWPPRKHP